MKILDEIKNSNRKPKELIAYLAEDKTGFGKLIFERFAYIQINFINLSFCY